MGHGDNWNLSTGVESIYEWKTGNSEGLEIPRDNFQLVQYIYYLTDPSWIMASIYGYHLFNTRPTEKKANEQENWNEVILKESPRRSTAVYVSDEPLWFHGMRFSRDANESEVFVSKPEIIDQIPDDIRSRRDALSFEASEKTLARHMVFL